MNNASAVLSWTGLGRYLRQFFGTGGRILALLGIALLVSGSTARAQTTAQLTGVVQDSSGAVIPGAQITLTDQAAGTSRTIKTNGQGLYAFPALVPSTYTIKADAKNF